MTTLLKRTFAIPRYWSIYR